MNKHISSVVPFRKPIQDLRRDEIVAEMAATLVAEILHNSLDTSREQDVIQVLLDAPARWQSRVVLNHMDDALDEANQTLMAREMGDS